MDKSRPNKASDDLYPLTVPAFLNWNNNWLREIVNIPYSERKRRLQWHSHMGRVHPDQAAIMCTLTVDDVIRIRLEGIIRVRLEGIIKVRLEGIIKVRLEGIIRVRLEGIHEVVSNVEGTT